MSELGQEEHLLSEFEHNKPQLKKPQEVEGVLVGSYSDPQKI